MSLKINRLAAFFLLLITIAALLFINLFLSDRTIVNDTVKVSEIVDQVESNIDNLESFDFHNGYDFVVTDNNGAVLYSTNSAETMSIAERKNEAIKNNMVIIDFSGGYIFIDTAVGDSFAEEMQNLKVYLNLFIILLMLVLCAYYLFIYLRLIKPFNKMKDFAQNIAAGNLDIPVTRSRHNYFGAFTESFDIMREELKAAEVRANEAEKSKKELVAQLSHDIKTPLASIKAVAEVIAVGATDSKTVKRLELLTTKTNEIDRLISDLFAHTLEELSELKINCIDIPSGILQETISRADINEKVKFLNPVPDCMIKADVLRLQQVFDNIISNSYKYADTNIEVSFTLFDKLTVTVRDFGNGVTEDELPLIANKFYRGGNAGGKAGSGLGLNIAANFMDKMGGGIEFANVPGGFEVKIHLKLS